MKKYNSIELKVENNIALITLNNPKKLNALDSNLKAEMADVIFNLKDDSEVKVLIITGKGRAFCAGGDVAGMHEIDSSHKGRQRIKILQSWIVELVTMEKPVIAAVNGLAVGAGCNLALACDIIIASEKAKFSEIFVNVGLIPDAGGLFFLPRLVGPAKAKELVFTGDIIDSKEAKKIGLVNYTVKDDELLSNAMELAIKLKNGPSKAIGLAKTLINKSLSWDFETLLEAESLAQGISMQTEDFKEGVSAFKEKRQPKFKGQ